MADELYRFKVAGADKISGAIRTTHFDAPDEQSARARASHAGLMVSEVDCIGRIFSGGVEMEAESHQNTPKPEFEYKMVQIPPSVTVKQDRGKSASAYLEVTVNQYSRNGWDFFRVDPITVDEQPGCLGSLMGMRQGSITYHVITFRKKL